MSTPPTPANKPRRSWTPSAGDVVMLGAALNLSYAAVVICALANPGRPFAAWIGAWIHFAQTYLQPAYLLAGAPQCGGANPGAFVATAWAFDVHLITVNLIVVTALFAASGRLWESWSYNLNGGLGLPGETANSNGAGTGFGAVLLGAIAAVWWLVLLNDLFDSAAHCASLQPWYLFRSPFLATAAHGFASFAAASRAKLHS